MSHRGVYDPMKSPLAPRPIPRSVRSVPPRNTVNPVNANSRSEMSIPEPSKLSWSYGVTTIPARRHSHLPRTLRSMALAGWDRPRLFVDGVARGDCGLCKSYQELGLEITGHYPEMKSGRSTYGNWAMALAELYARDQECDRYAIFQDDVVCCLNLRKYLDACAYPSDGYWNLYTFPVNYRLIRKIQGWGKSNQRGLGALALVFNRSTVVKLLSSSTLLELPVMPVRLKTKGRNNERWRAVDGAVVTAMKNAGYREYVHNPSLVQHTGIESYLNQARTANPVADSFRGENFDAMKLCTRTG